MENKLINWARTLLVSYKYLEQLCDTIDRVVKLTAQSSYFNFGSYFQLNDINNVSNKLYKLINKKIDYVNIKVIVDKALKNMPKRRAKYLILKYIQNLQTSEIAEVLNISSRTYFRYLSKCLDEFNEKLLGLGYTPEKLEMMYSGDSFIMSIYNSVSKDSRFLVGSKTSVSDFDFDGCMDMLIKRSLTKIVI